MNDASSAIRYHPSNRHLRTFHDARERFVDGSDTPSDYLDRCLETIEAREPDGVIWEQHEIELDLDALPRATDGVLLAQWVLRNLAHRGGMRCSTEPMMVEGHAGNGLHFHISPARDGQPVAVQDEHGRLSDPARWLIGGLTEAGAALMAFGNRARGSLERLVQAKEAPNAITWGHHDRSALIRLPARARDSVGRPSTPDTVEFRLPDGSAFPHLLLAGVAMAAVRGSRNPELDVLLEATSAARLARGGEGAQPVPRSFAEVAAALAQQRSVFEAGGVFPEPLLRRMLADLENL